MSFTFCNHSDKEKSLPLCLGAKLVKCLLGEIVFLSQLRSVALFVWKTVKATYLLCVKLFDFKCSPSDEMKS